MLSKKERELSGKIGEEFEIFKRVLDPRKTLEVSEYEFWYEKYQELKKEVTKELLTRTDAGKILKSWRDYLKNELVRIFSASELYFGRVEHLENWQKEIAEAIEFNENELKEDIKKAVKHFGPDFLEKKLLFNPQEPLKVSNQMNGTVTVKEVLEASVTDWTRLTIKCGVPIPFYHSWFNNNLPYILDEYID